MTNKSLGRGLSAFLDVDLDSEDAKNRIIRINVNSVKQNPFQPRQIFNEESLDSLAESIRKRGVLQPIIVVKSDDENYQLIAGERRLRASKIANINEIPAIIVEASEKDQLEIAILENIQREDLNPLEEAEAYEKLMKEFQYTQEELSEILGKSRSHVANVLRLLTLPNEVKILINEGKLTFGHARALVGVDDAILLANQIVKRSLSVRQVENIIKQHKGGQNKSSENRHVDPDILNLSDQISSLIGLKVNIKLKGAGGVVEILFSDFQALDSLVNKLNN